MLLHMYHFSLSATPTGSVIKRRKLGEVKNSSQSRDSNLGLSDFRLLIFFSVSLCLLNFVDLGCNCWHNGCPEWLVMSMCLACISEV